MVLDSHDCVGTLQDLSEVPTDLFGGRSPFNPVKSSPNCGHCDPYWVALY